MPYNSSSFEKQLAKYKAAQAEKSIKAMADDPHVIKSRVNVDRGAITPAAKMTAGDGTAPVLRDDQQRKMLEHGYAPIIVEKAKKPYYQRGWFVFLMFSILSTAAVPVFFQDEMKQVMDVSDTVKTTTGVDPFSVKTYSNMLKGTPIGGAPAPEAQAAPSMDIHTLVDQAQEKADNVTSQGAGQSMEYIEQETKRLQTMAKEFDDQYKK